MYTPEFSKPRVLSVSQLNFYIKSIIENDARLNFVFVTGEISNLTDHYRSGHIYLSIKDEKSVIRAVMFAGNARNLKFRPTDGMKVICRGRVAVYEPTGQYQLYIEDMQPDGVGALTLAFEQLKKSLAQKGLFDNAHKKPLPECPERIAIITSSAGAAVHDMIRILRRRYPIAKVLLLPVRVQGVEAPPEIVGAIRYANRYQLADVLITGRGGGSLEDLWAFNDERVARAIYESEIPVISAVGHEPDVAISDFVADRRASTPSNAAEIAVPDMAELFRYLQDADERMAQSLLHSLRRQEDRLAVLEKKRVLTDPTAFLADRRLYLDHVVHRLYAAGKSCVEGESRRFAAAAAALDALSPLKVLARGYAVAQSGDGTILKNAADAAVGERIRVRLAQGSLQCNVVDKED